MGGKAVNYKRPLVLDIITWFHSLFLFACIYPFLASLVSLKGAVFWRMTLSGLLLFIPIVAGWYLTDKLKYMLQYILAAIPVAVLTTALSYVTGGMQKPGLLCAVCTGLFSVFIFALRIKSRIVYGNMKREFLDVHENQQFDLQEREMPGLLNCPQAYHWVWFTLLYLSGMLLHFTKYLYIMFAILFVDIFLCLGFHYISSLYEFARSNQSVANFPLSTMKKIHRMTGIIGCLLLALFLLPAVLFGREFEPDLTTNEPLLKFEDVMHETQMAYEPEITDTQMIEAMDIQKTETPEWLLYLTKILGYLGMAVLLSAFTVGVIRRIKNLGKDFSVEEEDEVVFLEPDKTDSITGIFRKKGRDSFLSANQQIRKRYKKTIKKASKEKPSRTATPAELEKNAGLEGDSIQPLHELYEKARYSEEGCTAEDLK